jgi:hypothetical protein
LHTHRDDSPTGVNTSRYPALATEKFAMRFRTKRSLFVNHIWMPAFFLGDVARGRGRMAPFIGSRIVDRHVWRSTALTRDATSLLHLFGQADVL